MAEIADSLLNPLSAKDRAAFDVMYIGQPWLGDIPLVLLRKHFDLVGEICLDILANPTSAELKGQLLRVLEWHGSMVSKKREADRLRKNSSVSRNLEGRPTKAFTNTDDDFVTPERPQASVYQQAAGKFRELRNASCPCGCLSGWQASFSVDSLREDTVQWVDVCGNCNHQEPVEVSREDFGRRVDEVDV
jgi:hypothetical protein